MDPKQMFVDKRHLAYCVFCGATPSTREHVVSRVLLDDPLPDDLPIVGSCLQCNKGFAMDEEYTACLIECVVSGSTSPEDICREKIRSCLEHSSQLASRIEAGRTQKDGVILWKPERDRVSRIIVKLARGHLSHQYGMPQLEEPTSIGIEPLPTMSGDRRDAFERVPLSDVWPEVGSRAFMNLFAVGDHVFDGEAGWSEIQTGRYRFMVAEPDGFVFRVVLSEYLAGEVIFS